MATFCITLTTSILLKICLLLCCLISDVTNGRVVVGCCAYNVVNIVIV